MEPKIDPRRAVEELYDEELYELAAEYEAERQAERDRLDDEEMDEIERYFFPE